MRRSALKWLIVATVLLAPLFLELLYHFFSQVGLLWIFAACIYYLPVLWIGEPHFLTGGDGSFVVSPVGRAIGFLFYAGLLWLSFGAFRAAKAWQSNYSLKRTDQSLRD